METISNIQTAKAIAKAYLLRVAVQNTYDLTGKSEINQRIWDQLFADQDVLHDLNKNIIQNSGLFQKPSLPDPSDLEALRLEFTNRLPQVSRWNQIRDMFLACEMEDLLGMNDEIVFTDIIEDMLVSEFFE